MKIAHFAFAALLAAGPGVVFAQTNLPPVNPPAPSSGPVVMPPPESAPPATPPPEPSADATPAPAREAAPPPAPAPSFTPSPAPAAQPAPAEDIYDIRPPLFFLHSWLWLWILLGAIALVALIILLWRWFGPRAFVNPTTAYELTLAKLEKARVLMDVDNPEPYAVAVSEAIRTYLGPRFGISSPHRTTEEFFRQMESDPATPLAPHRDLLREFLQSCDLLKFARYQPSLQELEQTHQHAVSFVTATKPVVSTAAPAASSDFVPRVT